MYITYLLVEDDRIRHDRPCSCALSSSCGEDILNVIPNVLLHVKTSLAGSMQPRIEDLLSSTGKTRGRDMVSLTGLARGSLLRLLSKRSVLRLRREWGMGYRLAVARADLFM